MLPNTADRVPRNTAREINASIERTTERRVRFYAENPRLIAKRLGELDREWDIERALETNASALVVLGAFKTLTSGRHWALLPIAVGGFLAQHALMGWCPPLPVLRRLGFRTSQEIDRERQALKALRGDYVGVAMAPIDAAAKADASAAMRAAKL